MNIARNSIHLQDFPDLSFILEEKKLIEEMDLVRNICSTSLAIRDSRNLRVRLPLSELKIIGKNLDKIVKFNEIIAEEVNVKAIKIEENIDNFAELKLQINFKKIGSKFGKKIQEITKDAKNNKWQKISNKKVAIAGIELIDDEFELKLIAKNIDENKFAIQPLASNDCLVLLDVEVSKELENEGIARDIVRAVQQNRRDANLDISNQIKLQIFTDNSKLIEATKHFMGYISKQVLAEKIELIEHKNQISAPNLFANKIEDGEFVACIETIS